MLYHTNLGFPSSLNLKEEYLIEPKYSVHAFEASKTDRYGTIMLSKFINFGKKDIIEVETEDNIKADKIVIRLSYSSDLDVCIVIILETKVVKTVWLNNKNDKHQTLNVNKYTKL